MKQSEWHGNGLEITGNLFLLTDHLVVFPIGKLALFGAITDFATSRAIQKLALGRENEHPAMQTLSRSKRLPGLRVTLRVFSAFLSVGLERIFYPLCRLNVLNSEKGKVMFQYFHLPIRSDYRGSLFMPFIEGEWPD